MDITKLKEIESLVKSGNSTWKIAQACSMSQSNVRYWLRQLNLKTKSTYYVSETKCTKCGQTNPLRFYHKRRLCADCNNDEVVERGRRNRQHIVDLMGGKCKLCGYNQYACGLDVHHLDPQKKDKNFSTMRFWSLERILKEIKKCILVCKCCHAAIHTGQLSVGP